MIALVAGLLGFAAVLRLIYAHGLPIDLDDALRLSEARKISLMPGAFYFPLTSPDGRHPALCAWLVTFANWIGRENAFAIRSFFVFLHVVGLLGLFQLTRILFGPRAALLALALAAIDRFLVTWSAQILEPGFFFLAPWVLYTAYRCVHFPFRGCWAVLGALSAAAFLYYELALFLAFPVGLLLVSSSAGRRSLRTAGPYAAGAAVASVVVFQQIWNVVHNVGTFKYAAVVSGSGAPFALSPRVLLLYMGDLLLSLKDAVSVTLGSGMDFYLPTRVPCFWTAGVAYLACVAYGLRLRRDPRVSFLLMAFLAVALPLSFFLPRDPWNNIHYAGQTVMPAIALSAWIAVRTSAGAIAPRLLGAFVVGMTLWISLFLSGPKWGYFTPNEELAYCGKIFWYANRNGWNERGLTDEDRAAMRRLTDAMAKSHPDSLVVQYHRLRYAVDLEEAADALRQAKRIDPRSPMTALIESAVLEESGDLAGARDCLKAALASHDSCPDLELLLAGVEYKIGNYAEAVRHADQLARSRPEYTDVFRVLFFAYDALGDAEAVRRAFDAMRYWNGKTVAEANLVVAQDFVNQERIERAVPYVEEAFRLEPDSSKTQFAMGVILAKLGDLDRAESLLDGVLRADPTHAQARAWLEQVRELKKTALQEETDAERSESRKRETDK